LKIRRTKKLCIAERNAAFLLVLPFVYDSRANFLRRLVQDINFRKQGGGPDSRTFTSGLDVSFNIEVENLGVEVLENVTVTDPLVPAM
jgi:uncharacterized repeat protein (TIGR01451 family)